MSIIPLNGAAEALYMIIGVERPSTAIIFEPTFGDHKPLFHTLSINYVAVQYTELFDRYVLPLDNIYYIPIPKSSCILLFSNPNNPLGTCISIRDVEEILQMYRDCIVVVDEAFMDLSNNCNSAFELAEDYRNLVILRSLTKTFAVPGLRIGFLYTMNRDVLNRLEAFRQPWNVNNIAAHVFSRALTEYRNDLRGFIEYSKEVVVSERQYLEHSLYSLGIHLYKSHAPYILVRFHRDVEHVQGALEKFKIWIRDASSFQTLTKFHGRISVRLRNDNEKLITALRNIFEENQHNA